MNFFYKNTNKYIIITKEDEEPYRNKIICQFCEKNLNLIKLDTINTLQVNIEDQLIVI